MTYNKSLRVSINARLWTVEHLWGEVEKLCTSSSWMWFNFKALFT